VVDIDVFSLMVPQCGPMTSAMEPTWILGIEVIGLFATDLQIPSSRTRDLTESACMVLAEEAPGPKARSYCYETGTLDPGWHRPRVKKPKPCEGYRPLPGRRWV